MLKNPSFEGGWTRRTHTGQQFGEIFVPEGWVAYWREGGTVPHDAENPNGYGRPETHVIDKAPPYLDPERIFESGQAFKMFTFFRIHDGGLYQRVEGIVPGTVYRFGGHAHAWSSSNDDAHTSNGVGDAAFYAEALDPGTPNYDDKRNFTFRVGIDPYGGTNPWSDQITWGRGAHIYNAYHEIPFVDVKAMSDAVTVFVRSEVLWPFKHCDAYLDAMSLEVVETPGTGEPSPALVEPREIYMRTYVLMPPDADARWVKAAVDGTWDKHRVTYGGSPDDAGFGLRDYRKVIIINPDHWSDNIEGFFRQYYAGIQMTLVRATSPDDLRHKLAAALSDGSVGPSGGNIPRRKGSLIGLHHIGGDGIVNVYEEIARHGTPPPFKHYGLPETFHYLKRLKEIDPNITLIGRLSRIPWQPDLSIEGPDLSDPIASAARIYTALRDFWLSHPEVDYWEIINENDPDDHGKLALLFQELIQLVRPVGVKLGLFSYSLGVPEPEEWAMIRDNYQVLQMARDEGHMISIHEYGYMDRDYPHIIGRFEWMYEALKDILEGGLDVYVTEWNTEAGRPGLSKNTEAQWMSELKAYDALCQKYSWIKGVNLFTTGSVDAGNAWDFLDPARFGWLESWKQYVISRFADAGGGSPIISTEPLIDEDLRGQLTTRDDYENMAQGLQNGWWVRKLSDIDGLTVHHVDGDWTPEQAAHYHVNEKEYGPTPSIHYHLWITQEGKVLQVNDFEQGVWHDHTGHRNTHLAVVLEGDLAEHRPTDAQLTSLVKVAHHYIDDDRMNITAARVKGHCDYAATVCPGWKAAHWREDFYRRLGRHEASPAVWGVHSPISVFPVESVSSTVGRLRDLGIRHYKLIFNGDFRENQEDQRDLVQALVSADIQPIVRLYQPRQAPHRNHLLTHRLDSVRQLIEAYGDKAALFEVVNEPNLPVEWAEGYNPTWQDNGLVTALVTSWYEDAMTLLNLGARPAIPAFAPTDRGGTHDRYSGVMWLRRFMECLAHQHPDLQGEIREGRIWAASHSAAFARPFDFDPVRPGGRIDDMCLRSYEIVKQTAHDTFDVYPNVISTEGGVYSPFHMYQLGWSASPDVVMLEGSDQVYYDIHSWGQRVVEAFTFLSSQARPLKLDGMCMWHFSDEGSAAEWKGGGWHAGGWVVRSPIEALRQHRVLPM